MDNQAFDWGIKFKCLEKYCARQKEIHEQIREANVQFLKDLKYQKSLFLEADRQALEVEQ